MLKISLIPMTEFQRVDQSVGDTYAKLEILSDMCRLNTLAAVKLAGSGHIGSSFSAMDIAMLLYYNEMNVRTLGVNDENRDIYFSSKGHDVPGLYSIFCSLGIISEEKLLNLRKLNGLDGHPDVATPGIESNTGSLGMGISKGRGMAWAKKYKGNKGHVYVMTGDGELQEGQIYESLQTTVHQKINNITVIVDHNKFQTDKPVSEITALGDLEAKFKSFGWHVVRCNGHDFAEMSAVLKSFKSVNDKPKILIADTIKGKGVSFMEPNSEQVGVYRWHSGAPDDESFEKASQEIIARINQKCAQLSIGNVSFKDVTPPPKKASVSKQEYVAEAYGKALLEISAVRKDVVVLDGDLAADCRIRGFEEKYPARFIENGIAEQDMVSMAGGLARQGLLPIVNTFGSFLSARANEQIYNNACEKTKIIYACHFSGCIPAGPGKSHQSVRDISLFGALPNCTIMQPCNGQEVNAVLDYAINTALDNCVIRLAIGPSPCVINLPSDFKLTFGQGTPLTGGEDAVLFAYGPVMLNEAMTAAEILKKNNFGLTVVNMPWLNRVDAKWLSALVRPFRAIYVLEDHSVVGGLGDRLLESLVQENAINEKSFKKFGLNEFPACGTPQEVLNAHALDGASLANRILGGDATLSDDHSNYVSSQYTSEAPQ